MKNDSRNPIFFVYLLRPVLHYDALGRNYRTHPPDETITKTVWTSWHQEIWDANDTVLQSDWYALRRDGILGTAAQMAAQKTAAHADTPTLVHTDSLGRGFYTLQVLSATDRSQDIHSYEVLDEENNRLFKRVVILIC